MQCTPNCPCTSMQAPITRWESEPKSYPLAECACGIHASWKSVLTEMSGSRDVWNTKSTKPHERRETLSCFSPPFVAFAVQTSSASRAPSPAGGGRMCSRRRGGEVTRDRLNCSLHALYLPLGPLGDITDDDQPIGALADDLQPADAVDPLPIQFPQLLVEGQGRLAWSPGRSPKVPARCCRNCGGGDAPPQIPPGARRSGRCARRSPGPWAR